MNPSKLRASWHRALRQAFSLLPRSVRFAAYRSFVDCDPSPDPRLHLKIAETRDELEACFGLLHDAYVASGFMKPHPSGLRVTLYHALPTTTTLCATFDGEVVGTLSLIRESVMGFPLQSIFDLHSVREQGGMIAEVSALAVHPKFRKTGGSVLFPLMKFMHDYCTGYFDTRHLVIAVNPNRIELYESLLLFDRLPQNTVDNYDFANGAPAVGATLDLHHAAQKFRPIYTHKPLRRNLHHYFNELTLPNIELPARRYHTTNDPVMTPALLDYFFNQRTQGFAELEDRKIHLLHAIYNLPAYRAVLPSLPEATNRAHVLRSFQRFSVKCPCMLRLNPQAEQKSWQLKLVDVSENGFQVMCDDPLPLFTWGQVEIELGHAERSSLQAQAVWHKHNAFGHFYGFEVGEPDLPWRRFVLALESGSTVNDLENASRFMEQ